MDQEIIGSILFLSYKITSVDNFWYKRSRSVVNDMKGSEACETDISGTLAFIQCAEAKHMSTSEPRREM